MSDHIVDNYGRKWKVNWDVNWDVDPPAAEPVDEMIAGSLSSLDDENQVLALALAQALGLELVLIWADNPLELEGAGGTVLKTAADYRKAAVQLVQVADLWTNMVDEAKEVWEDD